MAVNSRGGGGPSISYSYEHLQQAAEHREERGGKGEYIHRAIGLYTAEQR